MMDAIKAYYDSMALKMAFGLHFIFQIIEKILNTPVSDLLQNITSVLSILFIVLKSIETYKNIKSKSNVNNK